MYLKKYLLFFGYSPFRNGNAGASIAATLAGPAPVPGFANQPFRAKTENREYSMRSPVSRYRSFYLPLALFGAVSGQTLAQETASDDSAPQEEVIVTGSYIPRATDEGALPVQVVTQEQIARTGAATVEQLLQTITSATQGNSNTVVASVAGANTAVLPAPRCAGSAPSGPWCSSTAAAAARAAR